MSIDFNSLLAKATLATALAASGTVTAQTSQPSLDPLTVNGAKTLIQNVNRAVDSLFALSIVNAFNPSAKVNVNGQKIEMGITREICEKAVTNSRLLVNLDTYILAQDVLVNNNLVTKEKSTKDIKIQRDFMSTIQSQVGKIEGTCAGLEVSGFRFPDGWK